VKGLGPDNVIDYTAKDARQQLEEHGKYANIIFINISYNYVVVFQQYKKNVFKTFINIVSNIFFVILIHI